MPKGEAEWKKFVDKEACKKEAESRRRPGDERIDPKIDYEDF